MKLPLLLAGTILSGLVACGTEPTKSSTEEIVFLPAKVPAAPVDAACGGDSSPIPLCEWALSFDAIVIAEIESAVPYVETTVATVDGQETVVSAESCSGPLNPGLELRVRVTRSLVAAVQPPEELTIHIGFDQTREWEVHPVLGPSDAPAWSDGSTWTDRFQPGGIIGLPLSLVPSSGLWSLMGEPAFELDVAGNVLSRGRYHCTTDPLPNGEFLDSLEEAVAACSETPAAGARKSQRLENAALSLDRTHAARCFPPATGGCQTHLDCPHEAPCVDGACAAAE